MLAIFKHRKGCHLEGQDLFFIIPGQNNGFKLQEDYGTILGKNSKYQSSFDHGNNNQDR